ncbi:hypothetical protein [Thioclava sp. JM3]|nr:hypothetical protein [Thioclava sp. JM3]
MAGLMKLQRSGLTKAEGQLWAVNEVMQEWAEKQSFAAFGAKVR